MGEQKEHHVGESTGVDDVADEAGLAGLKVAVQDGEEEREVAGEENARIE